MRCVLWGSPGSGSGSLVVMSVSVLCAADLMLHQVKVSTAALLWFGFNPKLLLNY